MDVAGGGKNGIPAKIKLDIWDTPGNEALRFMFKNFLNGSHAVIFVYDVTSSVSFRDLDLLIDFFTE